MSPTPLLPLDLGWERWQGSRLSKRLLSDQARQDGYSVVRVPPALRTTFLAMATLLTLYETSFPRQHQTLTPAHLDAFVAWHNATQELIALLRKA